MEAESLVSFFTEFNQVEPVDSPKQKQRSPIEVRLTIPEAWAKPRDAKFWARLTAIVVIGFALWLMGGF